jgi:hypothetical protein
MWLTCLDTKSKSDDSALLSPPNTDANSEGSSSGERKDLTDVHVHKAKQNETPTITSATSQINNARSRHPLPEVTGSSTGASGEEPVSPQTTTQSSKESLALDTSSTVVKPSEDSPVVSKSEKTSDSELDAVCILLDDLNQPKSTCRQMHRSVPTMNALKKLVTMYGHVSQK